jgi:hypothetical protein
MGFHPEGVGKKLRFVRDRQIGKHRWVVTRFVEPRS